MEDIKIFFFTAMLIYLLSSMPIAFIWIKISQKGLDLTEVGTGNIGAANTKNISGIISATCIATIDIFLKGFIPIYIVDNFLGYSWEVLVCGLIIVLGHNWSIFMNFKGGRGIAVSIGILLALDSMNMIFLVIAIPIVIGRLIIYKDSGFWTFITIVLLNLVTYFVSPDIAEKIFTTGLAFLLIVKRILTNRYYFPEHISKLEILFYRIIFDRDIKSKYLWTNKLTY